MRVDPKDDRITFVSTNDRRPKLKLDLKQMRVGLGFLLTDALPFAPVWEKWLADAKANGLQVVPIIHNKKPINAALVVENELPEKAPTTWENTIQAHRLLVKAARDKGCDFFILVCGNTIPTTRPDALFQFLSQYPYSHFGGVSYANWKGPHGQKDKIARKPHPDTQNNYKHEQWYCLHKSHFAAFDDDKFAAHWDDAKYNNEMYPLAAIQRSGNLKGITKHPIMRVEWPRTTSPHPFFYVAKDSKTNAKPQRFFSVQFIQNAVAARQFFMRKIHPSVDINLIIKEIGLPV